MAAGLGWAWQRVQLARARVFYEIVSAQKMKWWRCRRKISIYLFVGLRIFNVVDIEGAGGGNRSEGAKASEGDSDDAASWICGAANTLIDGDKATHKKERCSQRRHPKMDFIATI